MIPDYVSSQTDSINSLIDSLKILSESNKIFFPDSLIVMGASQENYGIPFIIPLVISIVAVVISILVYLLIRKHNILITKPLLNIDSDFSDKNKHCGYTIANYGFGPAIIESLILYWEGKEYSDWNKIKFELNDKYYIEEQDYTIYPTFFDKGSVIPANTTKDLLKFNFNLGQKDKEARILLLNESEKYLQKNLVFKVVYKSIYDKVQRKFIYGTMK